jgi:hypothetical protein
MTQLLEKAFAEAAKLPPQEQDVLASQLLEEMQSELQWQKAFGGSQDALARQADEALAEHHAGKTDNLDLE